MRISFPVTILATSLLLGGCARWAPSHRPGPVTFDRACPLRRAPQVASFGTDGVRGVYHFAVQGAPNDALDSFFRAARAGGFRVVPMMININGADTLVVSGSAVLHDQRAVDSEFRTACQLGSGPVYLSHVRHDPPVRPGEAQRVR